MKYAKRVAYRSLAVILAVLVTQQITTSIVCRLHQGVAAAGEPPVRYAVLPDPEYGGLPLTRSVGSARSAARVPDVWTF